MMQYFETFYFYEFKQHTPSIKDDSRDVTYEQNMTSYNIAQTAIALLLCQKVTKT